MSDEQNVAGGGVERRVHPRVPVETRVRVEYGSLRGFVEEVCRNVSIGGMFVQTPTPPPVGSVLRFELDLPDRAGVVHGSGEVAWVRSQDDPPANPAGFGLKFLDVPPTQRDLIFQVVDRFIQRGGAPFDLDQAG